ncbi:MAG TPA: hypothetical protein VGF38_06040, partial [Ktedonobacterales bacterium]
MADIPNRPNRRRNQPPAEPGRGAYRREDAPTLDDAGTSAPLGDERRDTPSEFAEWVHLTEELNNALARLLRVIQHATRGEDYVAAIEDLMTTVLQGVLQASEPLIHLGGSGTSKPAELIEHPTVQLAHAYVAALEAVGSAALLIRNLQPDQLTVGVSMFVQLAQRAAGVLSEAVGLLTGQRRLGSVANACKVIGELEDQADALFRSQIAALFQRDDADDAAVIDSGWTEQMARMVRTFVAL